VALDATGDLVIADAANNRVRFVPVTSGSFFGRAMSADAIYTIAGDGTAGFGGDGGPASASQLSFPDGVALDAIGDLAITDSENNRVRFVPARDGVFFGPAMTAGDIYTIAGNGTGGFAGDGGPATDAELFQPAAVAFDGAGNVLLADTGNNRVRMVTGTIPSPPAGSGSPGGGSGPAGGGSPAGGSTPGAPSNRFVLVSRRVKPNGDIVLVVKVPGTGRLSAAATLSITPKPARSGKRGKRRPRRVTVTYGRATTTISRTGTLTIKLKASRAAKRELARLHKVHLKLSIAFAPTGGTTRTQTYPLVVRRSRKGKFS
jgi:hypothetical protein